MNNLTKEYLKGKFFQDKDNVIGTYAMNAKADISVYEYTKGKVVIIDNLEKRAYSRNGYFFSVILKDNNYINQVENQFKEEIINFANEKLAYKYEEAEE